MLSAHESILIGVLAAALVLMIGVRLRPDVVALLTLLSLGLSQVLTLQEAMAGFSSAPVITLIGLFIITRALEEVGIIHRIGKRLDALGTGSETRLVPIFMGTAALLSLVMNNIAAGAVLLPMAVNVGRLSKVRLSKLLIPIAFGTMVGGMATYLTTVNIILSGILQEHGEHGLGMLDFMPIGGLIVVFTVLYMALLGRRWLPKHDSLSQRFSDVNLYKSYALDERLWELQIMPSSRLVGCSLRDSGIGEKLGLTVMGIGRGKRVISSPPPEETIKADDYLLVMGREDRVQALADWGLSFDGKNYTPSHGRRYNIEVFEVLIPPRSAALYKSLTDLNFRSKFGLTCVALWREGRSYRTNVGKFPLQSGDTLLVIGSAEKVRLLAQDRDYVVLHDSVMLPPLYPHKAGWALLITALVLLIAVLGVLPLPEVMLAGAVGLVLAGCLTMDEAYEAIEWRVIFLIAGMLPVSTAMLNTVLAERVGDLILPALQPYGALGLIGGMFLLAMAVTQVMGSQVAALMIGPIAVSAAIQMGVHPQAMAVAVAIGCSTAFLTPLAHPVNILVMGPAGYTFGDFFKVGLGMTIVTFAALLFGLVAFWGIR